MTKADLFFNFLDKFPSDEDHDIFQNGDMLICKSKEVAYAIQRCFSDLIGFDSLFVSPAFDGEDDGKGYWYVEVVD